MFLRGRKVVICVLPSMTKGEIVRNICLVVLDVKPNDLDWSGYSKSVYV